MSNFFVRTISAFIFTALILGSILGGFVYFLGIFTFVLFVMHYEFSTMSVNLSKPLKVLTSIINTLPFFLLGLNKLEIINFSIPFEIISVSIFLFYVILYIFYYTTKSFKNIVFSSFSFFYLTIPFILSIQLGFISGVYVGTLIIAVIVLNWANDTFAYLVGRQIGKHSLAKTISPKKTIEGSIGGVLGTLLIAYVLSSYYHLYDLKTMIIMALLVSFSGAFGDLFESVLKRNFNVKDSGNIMPGHGGLLDRFDSFLFAIPVVFVYFYYFVV